MGFMRTDTFSERLTSNTQILGRRPPLVEGSEGVPSMHPQPEQHTDLCTSATSRPRTPRPVFLWLPFPLYPAILWQFRR